MSTAYLKFPMADADGDLVFSGVEGDGNPFGVLSMSEPARPKRRTFAEDSAHVGGSLATQSVGALTEIAAVVRLEGASQAELETRKARMFVVLERLRFDGQQIINGVTTTYRCNSADITPAEYDLDDLDVFKATYSLTIPCYPSGA